MSRRAWRGRPPALHSTSVAAKDRWIVLGRAEIPTTELGEAAFEGRTELVDAALARGIDWGEETTDPLHGALYGGRPELARRLLAAGSPVSDDTYAIAYHHAPDILPELPPRPAVVERIEAADRRFRFNWALVRGEVETARALLAKGVALEAPILLSHGMGELRPIHHAVRGASFELIRLVAEAGADLNALTPEGTSPLRMVAESIRFEARERRGILRWLEARGARMIPPIPGLRARWRVRRGARYEGE